ncbi:MAG: TIGR02221 family CRISPR-associated protein [Paludibacteraceae bacterium]|nr:TIGR02221 family CRISPR-associated protein [Paludibacteraceae bacterium]
MARKVFISVLGTGPYSECMYGINNNPIMSTRYIQLATLKNLLQAGIDNEEQWTENDAALIFVTSKSKSDQWIVGKTREGIEREGLKAESEKMNLPFELAPIDIKDGKNEDEIWEIFNTIFRQIKEGDELYFDITHAFRYLPMLLLVLVNYAKFLKNVTVKSISYGNFMDPNDVKPIMDLTSISVLQDWTFAAGQYLENGSVSRLVSLCEQEFKPILRETKGADVAAQNFRAFVTKLSDVTEERKTCRGLDIIKSTSFKGLKECADNLEETFVDAFNPIFEKIKSSLVSFDEKENIRNGLSAAVWCYDNGLFQQAATILQEFVVSFFCLRHGIAINDDGNREIVNKAFRIKYDNKREEDWDIAAEKKDKLKDVLSDDLFENNTLVTEFKTLTDVRNDFNHSGMRSNPMLPHRMKYNIKKCICAFAVILFNIKID